MKNIVFLFFFFCIIASSCSLKSNPKNSATDYSKKWERASLELERSYTSSSASDSAVIFDNPEQNHSIVKSEHQHPEISKVSRGKSASITGDTSDTTRTEEKKTNPKVSKGLVLVILAGGFALINTAWAPLVAMVILLLGISFSYRGLKEIKQNPEKYSGKGIAIFSLILAAAFALVGFGYAVYSLLTF